MEIKQGKELDEKLAIECLGWTWRILQGFDKETGEPTGDPVRFLAPPDPMFDGFPHWGGEECEIKQDLRVPKLSSRIKDAWLLVDELIRSRHSVDITSNDDPLMRGPRWYCTVIPTYYDPYTPNGLVKVGAHDNPAMAVCLAVIDAGSENPLWPKPAHEEPPPNTFKGYLKFYRRKLSKKILRFLGAHKDPDPLSIKPTTR